MHIMHKTHVKASVGYSWQVFFHVIISAVHYLIFWLFLTLEVEQFSFLNSVLAVVYRLWHTSMNKCRPV
jgi:hypothetical protein